MALSEAQLAQLWVKAGGSPKYAVVMAKIAERESGGRPQAKNLNAGTGDHSIGLWQINQLAHRGAYGSDQALTDPLANARAAVAIFRSAKQAWGDPLKPWSTHDPAIDNKFIGAQAPVGAPVPGGAPTAPAAPVASGDQSQQRAGLISSYLSNQHSPDALTSLAAGLLSMGVSKQIAAKAVPATGAPGNSSVTAPGSVPDKVRVLIERANQIDRKQYNYEWGGGHNPTGSPSHGVGHGSGPGIGFDCSGAVSKVFGINPLVAGQFMSWGKPGKGKNVTVYAKGTHVLMEINGHFWGTSGSNPGGGAGWIPRGALSSSYLAGFVARHPAGL